MDPQFTDLGGAEWLEEYDSRSKKRFWTNLLTGEVSLHDPHTSRKKMSEEDCLLFELEKQRLYSQFSVGSGSTTTAHTPSSGSRKNTRNMSMQDDWVEVIDDGSEQQWVNRKTNEVSVVGPCAILEEEEDKLSDCGRHRESSIPAAVPKVRFQEVPSQVPRPTTTKSSSFISKLSRPISIGRKSESRSITEVDQYVLKRSSFESLMGLFRSSSAPKCMTITKHSESKNPLPRPPSRATSFRQEPVDTKAAEMREPIKLHHARVKSAGYVMKSGPNPALRLGEDEVLPPPVSQRMVKKSSETSINSKKLPDTAVQATGSGLGLIKKAGSFSDFSTTRIPTHSFRIQRCESETNVSLVPEKELTIPPGSDWIEVKTRNPQGMEIKYWKNQVSGQYSMQHPYARTPKNKTVGGHTEWSRFRGFDVTGQPVVHWVNDTTGEISREDPFAHESESDDDDLEEEEVIDDFYN